MKIKRNSFLQTKAATANALGASLCSLTIFGCGGPWLSAEGVDVNAGEPVVETDPEKNKETNSEAHRPESSSLDTVLQLGPEFQVKVTTSARVQTLALMHADGRSTLRKFSGVLQEEESPQSQACEPGFTLVDALELKAQYCEREFGTNSSPLRDFGVPRNHIELAHTSETELSSQPSKNSNNASERLFFSFYGRSDLYSDDRSLLNRFCHSRTKSETNLPMIQEFFRGKLPKQAIVWTCDVTLPDENGTPLKWKAAGVHTARDYVEDCQECLYQDVLEILYLSRIELHENHFLRRAQERVLESIEPLFPQ